tara:strand:+ start:120621 stop:121298 length:678 start_codon:yes stop_codon:yes gene_type:complete
MNIVGFIPYWLDYNDTNKKAGTNQKKLAGTHLINYSLQALNHVNAIDNVVIFASNEKVLDYVDKGCEYSFWKRPDYLDQEDVTIEEIISEFLNKSDADIVVLLHPNCPFLKIETISECIEAVKSGEYDSAFTAYKFHKFAWYKSRPLNYSLDDVATPKLIDIEPIIIEQASLYVFTKTAFQKSSRRIGSQVYIKEISHIEGHEVNEVDDFAVAELIINSGMSKEI